MAATTETFDRILIATGDPSTRFSLRCILQKMQYEVTAVEDGGSAWDHLQRPDAARLAIIDSSLSGIDPFTLCRRVRAIQQKRHTYFFLLTEPDQRHDVAEGTETGVDDYITKPLDAAQIQARIRCVQRIIDLQEELVTTSDSLRRARDEIDLINQLAPTALFTVDADRKVVHWNRRCEEITGLSAGDVLGRTCPFFAAGCGSACGLCRTHDSDPYFSKEVVFRHPVDGERLLVKKTAVLLDKTGTSYGVAETLEDYTERKLQEDRIHFLSFHDPLTGLANRSLLQDRLRMATASARRAHRQVALLLIDLDRFNKINDVLGHSSGDQLLQEAAARLSRALRVEDSCGRAGGDEFVVILPNLVDSTEAAHVAQRIRETLSRPFHVNGQEIRLTASIGISIYPENGNDFDSLFQAASLARNQLKEAGRNNYHFFTPAMNVRATETLTLELHLRRALERGEFTLAFQPQVCIDTGEIVAAEALLRWRSPELGEVPPDRFIVVAEERWLILQIGEWVLRSACLQNRQWQKEGLPTIPIAVNISALELHQHDFTEKVANILRETEMDPSLLELEITENVVMLGAEEVIARLHRLKEMGILLAMDDFGTGYSSLSYLRRFPFDKVKVDCSFVRDLDKSQDAVAITQAILGLARTLKLRTIAEGVETMSQLKFLQEQKCDVIQGFFFSHPLPAEEFATLLSEGRRLKAQTG